MLPVDADMTSSFTLSLRSPILHNHFSLSLRLSLCVSLSLSLSLVACVSLCFSLLLCVSLTLYLSLCVCLSVSPSLCGPIFSCQFSYFSLAHISIYLSRTLINLPYSFILSSLNLYVPVLQPFLTDKLLLSILWIPRKLKYLCTIIFFTAEPSIQKKISKYVLMFPIDVSSSCC